MQILCQSGVEDMRRWSSFDLGTGAAADCGRCSWWPEREKVRCPSHLASNPGDVLSFDLVFVSWWCNCCEKAAVACVCLSFVCTCDRNYGAAGTGPRLTRHQTAARLAHQFVALPQWWPAAKKKRVLLGCLTAPRHLPQGKWGEAAVLCIIWGTQLSKPA